MQHDHLPPCLLRSHWVYPMTGKRKQNTNQTQWFLSPLFAGMLVGIVPPNIRSDVYARMVRTKQMEQEAHSMFSYIPARSCLKSRKDLMASVNPSCLVGSNEESDKGYNSPWLTWLCQNRLRTGYTCSKEQRKKWGSFNGDTTFACVMAT